MKTPPKHAGTSLGDCLRAAEADANRFHGGPAGQPWHAAGFGGSGIARVAAFAMLATVAAALLIHGSGDEPVPASTVAASRAEPDNWMTRAPADVTPDETAPAEVARTAAPNARAEPAAMVVIDGGDIDIAATMPASVLQQHVASTRQDDGPRVAPMNVPTLPDERDTSPGEPEPAAPQAERPPSW